MLTLWQHSVADGEATYHITVKSYAYICREINLENINDELLVKTCVERQSRWEEGLNDPVSTHEHNGT